MSRNTLIIAGVVVVVIVVLFAVFSGSSVDAPAPETEVPEAEATE